MTNNITMPPDFEHRYQYVQQKYDNARFIGIDVLKVLLNIVIALNIVPIIFHQNVVALFKDQMPWIYLSWIYVLISVLTGFLAYVFVFEGYYHLAHLEAWRYLSEDNTESKKQRTALNERYNKYLNFAHYLGIAAGASFVFGVISIIIAICNLR